MKFLIAITLLISIILVNLTKLTTQSQSLVQSFLQMKEGEQLKSKKTRLTLDGRKCASKFVQNGKVYTDCTDVADPAGKNSKKEWCYVNPSEGGSTNWDYCSPLLDYDTIREKANQISVTFLPEIRKAIELVQGQQKPTQQCGGAYLEVQKQQQILDKETSIILKQLTSLITVQDQLTKMQTQWEEWETKIGVVIGEIEALESEVSESSFLENCEGILGYEKDNPGDGMKGEYYNNEDFLGNPLLKEDSGVDFDWNGQSPVEGIYPDNFSVRWTTFLKIPVSGKYQFKTMSDDGCALYINDVLIVSHFMGNTDGPKDSSEEDEEGDGMNMDNIQLSSKSHLENNINNFEEGKQVKPQRKSGSWSKQISVSSDSLFKMQILYYHSIHSKYSEDDRNYFKLFWRSDKFTEVEIHQDYLYLNNKQPPLKLMEYNSSWLIQFPLKNNEDAFIDQPLYKITDIPPHFLGLIQLRLPFSYLSKSINFYANNPIILYIAVNQLDNNPLPLDFTDTTQFLTMLRINKFGEIKNGKMKATESFGMKVYKKNFMNGPIDIVFVKKEEEEEEDKNSKEKKGKGKGKDKHGNQLIMWYSIDPDAAKLLSCGGLELQISKNDSPSFKECKSSSNIHEQYGCMYAFTGDMIDSPFKMWASDGEGIGSWIEVKFVEEYKVTYIIYKNRDNIGERNRELEIQFSNGVIELFEAKNSDQPQIIKFKPQIVTSIKFVVQDVYTANNNGGSFQIFGMACSDINSKKKKKKKSNKKDEKKQEEQEEEDDSEDIKILQIECKDSMNNNEYLKKKNYKAGDSFEAICKEQCHNNQNAKVYGNRVYSEDSSICKSSEHSGVNLKGMRFKVIVERFRNMYESSIKNTIQSEYKITNTGSKSMSFEVIKDDSLVQLDSIKVGQKLDLYNPKKQKWVPAYVRNLDRRKLRMLFLSVAMDGFSSEFDESIQFPNPNRLDYCGSKLSERDDCEQKSDQSSSSQQQGGGGGKKKDKGIKICFTSGKSCGEDYPDMMVDNGMMKRKNEQGYRYGWELDASMNLRTRGRSEDSILDNLILFPPDKKSQWCTGQMLGKVSCLPLKWTIEVPNGEYEVKVTVGDPSFSSAVSININTMILIDAQILKRNQYFTKDIIILVSNGLITIDGQCMAKDCNNVWSRINYIQINKHQISKPVKEQPSRKLGCGNAYAEGACFTGSQVQDCVFTNLSQQGVTNCAQLFKLVRIPNNYDCKDQRLQYKCIKLMYKDDNECKKSCPGGKCLNNQCQIEAV